MSTELERAAALIKQAHRRVALTGASFSIAAGIPDFRSATDGLWSDVDPMQVSSMVGFRNDPHAFYEWARPLAEKMVQATPTAAHAALRRLEELGHIGVVLTQNVDMLHQAVGYIEVYLLYGTIATVTCIDCGTQHQVAASMSIYLERAELPTCAHCDGYLKPDIILFGEPLDQTVITTAEEKAAAYDLMLMAGTTLSVVPASHLLLLAKGNPNDVRIIVINYDLTFIDFDADVVLRGDINQLLPQLVSIIEGQ